MFRWPLAALLPTFIAGALLAAPLQLAPGAQATVSFVAHGPVGMKIEGSSTALVVGGDEETALFTLQLGTLQTGIDLRDKHMKEALQVETNPSAELRVKRALVQLPAAGASGDLDLSGDLTLHGTTLPVPLHCHLDRSAGLQSGCDLKIDMTQFGLSPPSYLGVKVKPEVEVHVAVGLQDAPPAGGK